MVNTAKYKEPFSFEVYNNHYAELKYKLDFYIVLFKPYGNVIIYTALKLSFFYINLIQFYYLP